MPLEGLPLEVLQASASGQSPWGWPRIRWRDYIAQLGQLAQEHLGVPKVELERAAGEKEAWNTLLRLLS